MANSLALVNDATTLCLWPPAHINQALSLVSTTTGFQCSELHNNCQAIIYSNFNLLLSLHVRYINANKVIFPL